MIKENFNAIKEELPDDVDIIVVTKYHTVEETLEAYEAGVRDFGENRIEGFLEKREALPEDANVHFIGTLQSRKVKDIAGSMTHLHSLDRESVAKKIEQYAEHEVKCFVQVNVSEESTKHGLSAEEVQPFMEKLSSYGKVKIIGLMTMAPLTEDSEVLNNTFGRLKELRDELQKTYPEVAELSMGMSNDYEIALDHGATYIRIGSKIMGSR
ncbi:MAG TPA: YggS family pyridoxal phosphate-dependent enzyme [Candidatus Salinicoccus merdavium]|nr:YggS family pyridoxal phosphate-dependent enzyme [Candidatus Salinicoccus merdavium]